MNGFRVTPSRVIFALAATALLASVLAYLQLSFEGADVKTAIRLVEESKVGTESLGERMSKFLPLERRLCEAYKTNRFHGHMEVVCRDTETPAHEFRWRVSVIDGTVIPANAAADRMGKGEVPWPP
jgi:hypothetical protein